jgi:hypothetical protein
LLSVVKKGSNSWPRLDGGTPGPLSITLSSTRSPALRAEMRIAAGLGARIAHGIGEQVPDHLVEVARVELDRGLGRYLEQEALPRHRLVGDEFLDERHQPAAQADPLRRLAVAARELQHLGDQALQRWVLS